MPCLWITFKFWQILVYFSVDGFKIWVPLAQDLGTLTQKKGTLTQKKGTYGPSEPSIYADP